MNKLKANGFSEIYVETSKRSEIQGKAVHFLANPKASVCYHQGGDSVTLVGEVEIIRDPEVKKTFEPLVNRGFFKNGTADPRHVLLRFRATEATFWIEGRFRTVKYKQRSAG